MKTNQIRTLQNSPEALAMLAAQRQLYTEAKALNIANYITSILVTLLLMVSGLFIPSSTAAIIMKIFASLIMSVLLPKAFNYLIQKKINSAATIQQKFDLKVYQMNWDTTCYDKEPYVTDLIATKAQRYVRINKDYSELKDWYAEAISSLNYNDSITACQKENLQWDGNLRNLFRSFLRMAYGIPAILFLLVETILRKDLVNVFYDLTFLVPLITTSWNDFSRLRKEAGTKENTDKTIETYRKSSIQKITAIQQKIYSQRMNSYPIPDFFYKHYLEKMEKEYQEKISNNPIGF